MNSRCRREIRDRESRWRGGGASAAEAAVAVRVVAQRPQEVDLAEGGPEDLAEVVLRMGALPEHEAGEALLAAGADDEVRVGLPAGVEVLRDGVDGDGLGQLLEGGAALGVVEEERADRVGDLLA